MHSTWHFINSAYTLYCTTSHTKTLLMHSGFYSPHTVMHSGVHTVIIAPSQEPLRLLDSEIQFKSFLCVIFHHQRICEELKKRDNFGWADRKSMYRGHLLSSRVVVSFAHFVIGPLIAITITIKVCTGLKACAHLIQRTFTWNGTIL